MDQQSTQEDNSHSTPTNKELLSSSTMAKLSCFRKVSNLKHLSEEDKLRGMQNSGEHADEIMELDDDIKRKNSRGCIKNANTLQKDFNLKQFACTSHPAMLSKTKVTTIERSETEGSKCLNSRTKSAYTPLELQFLEVKSKNSDVILFVECGYRYRFFGEDAEVICFFPRYF